MTSTELKKFYSQISNKVNELKKYPDYEKMLEIIYSSFLEDGDVVIECGAGWGMHTKNYARLCGESGLILAFEAHPKHMQMLKKAVSNYNNVTLVENAVADFVGKSDFNAPEYINENGELKGLAFSSLKGRDLPSDRDWAIKKISVTVTRIDEFFNLFDKTGVKYIKLDIEGGEYDALLGGKVMLSSHAPIISFEYGPQSFKHIGLEGLEIFNYLRGFGYVFTDPFGNILSGDEEIVYSFYSGPFWEYWAVPAHMKTKLRGATDKFSDIDFIFSL